MWIFIYNEMMREDFKKEGNVTALDKYDIYPYIKPMVLNARLSTWVACIDKQLWKE